MLFNVFENQNKNSSDEDFSNSPLEPLSSFIFPNKKNFFDDLSSIPNSNEESFHIIQDNNPINLDEDQNIAFDSCISEKGTYYKTLKRQNEFNNSKLSFQNKKNTEDDNSFKFFSVDDIQNIFDKKNVFFNIKKIFENNKFIYLLECKLCKKKRKRDNDEKKYNELNENENRNKRGRKGDRFINREEHNKMSSDNIIKKIKGRLIQYLVIFINNILEKKEIDKNKIYKINYQYINQLKKSIDLELLEKSIKDILSMKITPKIKTVNENANKIFIEKIESKQEKVKDYDTIMFILNMKFKDFLSLFTYKKNIDDIIKEKGLEECSGKINNKKIEESLIGAEVLLNEIYEKNDQQYLSTFIFHLFNYERLFYVKSGRNNFLNNIKL